MTTVVTGAAGFIGSFVAQALLDRGDHVVGVDNLNGYYDPRLKQARLQRLEAQPGFEFRRFDIADAEATGGLFRHHRPSHVVHLAAQAGVRHSLEAPQAYVDANVTGFLNVLEAARAEPPQHLVYASTSAVYGGNVELPFSTDQRTDTPLSLYAATKRANELMAHAYGHLFGLPMTGLRFFTVYGPWGRPDMALFKFTQRILAGQPIDVFNHGNHKRDFTYIDDIVDGVVRALDQPPESDQAGPVYNLGNSQPVALDHFIAVIETQLGKTAEKRMLPLQPGDVPATWADIGPARRAFGYQPTTPVETGVARFVEWYLDYYDDSIAGT